MEFTPAEDLPASFELCKSCGCATVKRVELDKLDAEIKSTMANNKRLTDEARRLDVARAQLHEQGIVLCNETAFLRSEVQRLGSYFSLEHDPESDSESPDLDPRGRWARVDAVREYASSLPAQVGRVMEELQAVHEQQGALQKDIRRVFEELDRSSERLAELGEIIAGWRDRMGAAEKDRHRVEHAEESAVENAESSTSS
ncbi:hypothetical protein PENSPDRAFT_751357 [Peniophora sp. CONT]|nr:hypothetical protein PENSPDRAFT_751357 [Peniophora sp. CONT]